MSIIFYSYYIHSLRLLFLIIKLINKFNTNSHMIFIFIIKKIKRTILYFSLFLKIIVIEQ